MTARTLTAQTPNETHQVRVLMEALTDTLNEHQATASVGCSALVSVLLDVLIAEHVAGNPKIQPEMRRMAERMMQIADTPREQVVAMAAHLADVPGATVRHQ